MSLVDTFYDVLSGIGGTLFGIVITYALNYRRNRRMMNAVQTARADIDAMRAENARLMAAVRDKENKILAQEKIILELNKTRRRK